MEDGKKKVADLRQRYEKSELKIDNIQTDPLSFTQSWFQEALDTPEEKEPNTFSLATVDASLQPSIRTLLIKGIEEEGFIFYSNYKSRKGQHIVENPKGAILFFWQTLERQIRIEGTISKLDDERSLAYFQSRPKGSQIGAWASPQSEIISDRAVLEDRAFEIGETYKQHENLPKPPHWGGYILKPHYYEFWQGRANRLHDRFAYYLEEGEWVIRRLAP